MVSLFECIKDYDYYDDSNEEYTQTNSQIQTNLPIQTHCSGCGAPVNPHHEKCEYCGTYYLSKITAQQKYNKATEDFKTSMDLFKKATESSMISAQNDERLDEMARMNPIKRFFKRRKSWRN